MAGVLQRSCAAPNSRKMPRRNEAVIDCIIYWIGQELNGAHLTNKLPRKSE